MKRRNFLRYLSIVPFVSSVGLLKSTEKVPSAADGLFTVPKSYYIDNDLRKELEKMGERMLRDARSCHLEIR